MKTDELEQQLAAYGRAALEGVPPLDPTTVSTSVGIGDSTALSGSVGHRAPGWAVAIAVSIAVLMVGAAATVLTLSGKEDAAGGTSLAAPDPDSKVVPVDPVLVTTPLGTMQWTLQSERSPITYGLVEWQGRLLGLTSTGDSLRATDDGLSWVTVGTVPDIHTPAAIAARDGYLYVIDNRTRMPGGYIIRHPSAWRSPDLRTWEPVPVEHRIPRSYFGEIEVVVSDAGVVMVAAEVSWSGDDPSALSWVLTDTGFVANDLPAGAIVDRAGNVTRTVWAVDGGFVASDGSSVFFSDDGASWTELTSGGIDDRGIITIGRGPGGYVAIAEYGRTVLASGDGLTWRKLATPVGPGGEPTVGLATDLMPIGSGWIAFRDSFSLHVNPVLASIDGTEWMEFTPVSGVAMDHPVTVGPDLVLAQWRYWTDGWMLPGGTVEIRLLED
jgi:hypothetical protein